MNSDSIVNANHSSIFAITENPIDTNTPSDSRKIKRNPINILGRRTEKLRSSSTSNNFKKSESQQENNENSFTNLKHIRKAKFQY